jgi:hypothetical protein
MSEELPGIDDGTPDDDGTTGVDLDSIDAEIRDGLPAERERLGCARLNQVYFDGDNDAEVQARPAEEQPDYQARPKLVSYLTRRVIGGLTEHTYTSGPTRTLSDPKATAWLEGVYKDCGANALWKDCDRLATLQGTAAIQVAATGDPRRPIRLHVWSAEELAAWFPDDDALHPGAVCTITRAGDGRAFTLYTPDLVRRYRERRAPQGGRTVIVPDGPDRPNPYGRLPFVWVHHERPTRRFWVRGIGTLIRKLNARVDEKLSELAEAQRFYLKPIPLATGVPPGWRPKIAPGRFNVVPFRPGASGQPVLEPKVWFLQAQVNVGDAWADIQNTVEQGLSDLDIPLSAYRSEARGVRSGAAMITEVMPLLQRSKGRRLHFAEAERELAQLALAIGGGYYDWADAGLKAALLAESADPQLALAWPDDLRIPWMEAANVVGLDLDQGLTSRVKVLMGERGFSRVQAEAELAEIVADEALYDQLRAQVGLPPAAARPPDGRSLDDPPVQDGDGQSAGAADDTNQGD